MQSDLESQYPYLMKTYRRFPVIFERGEGLYLFDSNGERYLDFVAGVAVNSLGYANAHLTAELQDQVEKLLHVSGYFYTPLIQSVTERLCRHAQMEEVFFCNSGTEAIEAGLKLAKKWGKSIREDKNQIVVVNQSFHGRTSGSLSLTANQTYREPFLPLVPEVHFVEVNNCEELRQAVNEKSCLILLEPVLGEGGILPLDAEFLREARLLADENDALLMFDEIQSGFYRCGKFLASHNSGVQGDMVAMAKGLGGGFPLGALLSSGRAKGVFAPGDHGSTFGGNPMAMRAISALLDEGERLQLDRRSQEMGDSLIQKLNDLHRKYPEIISQVRGVGLMIGVQLNQEKTTAQEISRQLFERKILLITAGENTLRFVPPLTVDEEAIDRVISELSDIFSSL